MSEDEKSGILEAPEEPKEANNLRILEGDSLLQDPSEKKLDTIVAFNGLHKTTSEDGCPTAPENRLEDAVPMLETTSERRQRKISHLVVYTTCFVMSLGFSIVLTGVWPYMKQLNPNASKEFLGWVVAANPLGQMIASPFLGWCGNKIGSNRIPFILTIFSFICGNILYSLLPLTKPFSDYFIILSRFIVGVSSANVAICRSYIVSASKLRERTTGLAIMAAAQSLGFILGPSIQAALAFINFSTPITNQTESQIPTQDTQINPEDSIGNVYALAGWTAAILGVLNLLLFLPWVFKEFYIAEKEQQAINSYTDNESEKSPKPDYLALFILLFGFFVVLLVFVLIETLSVPLVLDLYAWTDRESIVRVGFAFTIMGVISVFVFPLASFLSKRVGETAVYVFLGIVPLTIGVMSLFPVGSNYPKIKYCNSTAINITDVFFNSTRMKRSLLSDHPECPETGCPEWQEWCFTTPIIEFGQLFLGCALCSIAYPVSYAIAGAVFSKMLRSNRQGVWMGILTSIGSMSRVVGPVLFTYIYTGYGTRWTIGSQALMLMVVMGTSFLFYRRFAPLRNEPKTNNIKLENR